MTYNISDTNLYTNNTIEHTTSNKQLTETTYSQEIKNHNIANKSNKKCNIPKQDLTRKTSDNANKSKINTTQHNESQPITSHNTNPQTPNLHDILNQLIEIFNKLRDYFTENIDIDTLNNTLTANPEQTSNEILHCLSKLDTMKTKPNQDINQLRQNLSDLYCKCIIAEISQSKIETTSEIEKTIYNKITTIVQTPKLSPNTISLLASSLSKQDPSKKDTPLNNSPILYYLTANGYGAIPNLSANAYNALLSELKNIHEPSLDIVQALKFLMLFIDSPYTSTNANKTQSEYFYNNIAPELNKILMNFNNQLPKEQQLPNLQTIPIPPSDKQNKN